MNKRSIPQTYLKKPSGRLPSFRHHLPSPAPTARLPFLFSSSCSSLSSQLTKIPPAHLLFQNPLLGQSPSKILCPHSQKNPPLILYPHPFFFKHPISQSKLFPQAFSYYTVPLLSKLKPQLPPWLWPTALPRVPRSSSLQAARSLHSFKALTSLPGASSMAKTNIIYVEKKRNGTKRGGSTL